MRRVTLRGHDAILKRVLIHVCAFNLGIVMRKLFGNGTPRGLFYRLFIHIFRRYLLMCVVYWNILENRDK